MTFLDYYNMSKDTDDAMGRIKETYPHYDVVLFNMFNTIAIEFVNPELHQEFLSAEKMSNYSKTDMEFDNLRRILGDGILTSEGNVWKMKRKVLQEIFNFNFIKGLAPSIANLADKALDKMEGESEGS